MKPKSNQQLKQERTRRGWSQVKVAKAIGIDSTTVSRWERGLSLPYPYYRERLSTLFGKTTLAAHLVQQRDITAYFPDGILWAGLGPTPDVRGHLSRWGTLLGLDASRTDKRRAWNTGHRLFVPPLEPVACYW